MKTKETSNQKPFIELRETNWLSRELKDFGWGNGYVHLPKGHKYYGVNYGDIPVNVHGSLTYSEQEGDYWVIGFDTAHFGDTLEKWPREKVLEETERLLKQIIEEDNKLSTRDQAIKWWNNLYQHIGKNSRTELAKKYFNTDSWKLNTEQIEEIWRKEVVDSPSDLDITPVENKNRDYDYIQGPRLNQKQYKEFNSELFKKYIDKFSDEDKCQALVHLIDSLNIKSDVDLTLKLSVGNKKINNW